MKKSTVSTLAIAAAMTLAFAGAARAADVKFPEKKDPAFTFTLPDGWKYAPDAVGNMIVHSPDTFCGISLTMIDDAETTKMAPADIAKGIFKGAGFTPTGKQEDVVVGGRNATTYYASMASPELTADIRITVVKLDDTHVATIAMGGSTGATADDEAALKKIFASFKFTAAAK